MDKYFEQKQATAKQLLSEGKYRECALLLGDTTDDKLPVELHQLRAEALWSLKRFHDSLPSFASYLRDRSNHAPFGFFSKARTAAQKAGLSQAEQRDFWLSCTDPLSKELGAFQAAALADPGPHRLGAFLELARKCLKKPEEAEIWAQSFGFLLQACRGEALLSTPELGRKSSLRKILVAGMGWSGSGAVYDYLSEFEEVAPIPGEATYLESPQGLKGIAKQLATTRELRKAAFQFFFHLLLGYGHLTSSHTYKDFRVARRKTSGQGSQAYAKNALHVTYQLARLLKIPESDKAGRQAQLCLFADEIANRLVAGSMIENKHALLDNCIHIPNLNLIQYLSDAFVICSVRDPRSNYVARLRESSGYQEPPESFARNYLKSRKELERKIGEAEPAESNLPLSNVILVRFEDFVISRRYREKIAGTLGLDTSRQAIFTKFRPWESIRNAVLHEEHGKSGDIDIIKNLLADYCHDPAFLPLQEAEDRMSNA